MYNHQLDTFIAVADAGSFSQAAKLLYISPNAIIKQINLLEENLGFLLFERTYRGIHLTAAGKSFYHDTKYLIQYSRDSIIRAKNNSNISQPTLRISLSLTTPVQFLVSLWPQIGHYLPQSKFELVAFENTPENAREIMKNFGQNIDLVAGIYSHDLLVERKCNALKLYDSPICALVSINHPLSSKEELSIDDLYHEHIMLIRSGYMEDFDRIRVDICESSPQIKLIDIPFFNIEVFNQCENENTILLGVKEWANVHPLLKVIPIKWEYTIPYGILYSLTPTQTVIDFLQTMSKIYQL